MTAAISAEDAVTAVYEAVRLAGDAGLTLLSIRAMTGLHGVVLSDALSTAGYCGILAFCEDDRRWIAGAGNPIGAV